jgi:hypothetical protein
MRRKLLVMTAAVGSLSAGMAVAALQPAETTLVTARFDARPVFELQRTCDAKHQEFRAGFQGTQTSADPRLAGNLEARVRTVVNTANGAGYTEGVVVVRDASTGAVKLRARVAGVLDSGGSIEGFINGFTAPPSSARVLANFNAQQNLTTGAVTGELGQDTLSGPIKDPAVLSNACQGARGHDAGGDDDD